MSLKLTIELVPRTSWYNNMRKVLSRHEWDKVRRKAYSDSGHQCAICGISAKLHCHEIWSYDDKLKRQKLEGFIALCEMCHHVKHIGFAGVLAQRGKLDYELVVRHFMEVNNCTRSIFDEYTEKVFIDWKKRSQHEWTVDLGKYQSLIKEKACY